MQATAAAPARLASPTDVTHVNSSSTSDVTRARVTDGSNQLA